MQILILKKKELKGLFQCPHSYQPLLFDEIYHNERNISPSPSKSMFASPLLSTISWKDILISFNYMKDRKDQMKERLDNIVISSSQSSIKASFVNKDNYLGDDPKNFRMLLKGIDVNNEKYLFRYNRTILPDSITSSYLFTEDFWGYYNGKHKYRIPYEWTEGSVNNPIYRPAVRKYVSDCEPNLFYTKAGVLEEIIYPTGGKTLFDFELNRGANVYNGINEKNLLINDFGGLRIKSITNYDNGKALSTKRYEYEGGTTTSIEPSHFCWKSTVFFVPHLLDPSGHYNPNDIYIAENEFASSGRRGFPLSDYGGLSFYNKVIEYRDSMNMHLGKTEYDFYREGPYNSSYIFEHDRGNIAPQLISKKDFVEENGQYTLVREQNNIYGKVKKEDFIIGIHVSKKDLETDPSPIIPLVLPQFYYSDALREKGFSNQAYFDVSEIKADASFDLLKEMDLIEYNKNGTVNAKTYYSYDSLYRVLSPIETRIENSNKIINTEIVKYPFNFSTEPYIEMVSKHIYSPIIMKMKLSNGKKINGLEYNYRKNDSLFVVNNLCLLTNGNWEKRIINQNYDLYGNPIFIVKDDIVNIVYIWSYYGKYPVAEIKNATYDDVKIALGNISPESLSMQMIPDMNKINNLRNILKSASISTYTYNSLFGMITATNSAGITTYYNYDSSGRLIEKYIIENGMKKVFNRYDYHYKN